MSVIDRINAIPRVQKLALGLGGASLLFLVLNRKAIVTGATTAAGAAATAAGAAFDYAKVQAFALALPSGIGQWAQQILNAAQQFSVDPFVIAGIMQNESLGGSALRPQGPGGTGDFTPRKTGMYAKYANPATGLPPDGEGWGRGLMQIDFGVHNAWVTSNNWRDPQVNINKGAEIFRDALRYFSNAPGGQINVEQWRINTGMPQYGIMPWSSRYPRAGAWPTKVNDPRPLAGDALYQAAIAGFNAGYTGPLQAIASGLPAEAVTANQNYVSRFLERIGGWRSAFKP